MTSLGRVGRILAGTADVSSLNYEKDGQSTIAKSVEPNSSSNTKPKATEPVATKEVETKPIASILQGKLSCEY